MHTTATSTSPTRSPSTRKRFGNSSAASTGSGAYYLLKLAEGTSTISVFDDQEGAEESSRVAAAWLAENLPDLSVAAPYVTAGEVIVGF